MVDLEWGLSPSEQEHGAIESEFRAKELQRCHDVSVGPSFVVSYGVLVFSNVAFFL